MKLDGGKYEIRREGDRVIAYRHGERWRELTGDNLIFWMMARIEIASVVLKGMINEERINGITEDIVAEFEARCARE